MAPNPDRSGIDVVDRAIAAALAGDSRALAALIKLAALECAPPAQGAGGPPVCLDGEAIGAIVNVLPTTSCEGSYARAGAVGAELDRFLAADYALVGVYEAGARTYPDGDYVVIVSYVDGGETLARALVASDAGVVGLQFGCGESPETMIERQGLVTAVFVP